MVAVCIETDAHNIKPWENSFPRGPTKVRWNWGILDDHVPSAGFWCCIWRRLLLAWIDVTGWSLRFWWFTIRIVWNIHKKIRYLENIARRNICHAKTEVLVIVEVTVPQLLAMLTSDDRKSLYKAIHFTNAFQNWRKPLSIAGRRCAPRLFLDCHQWLNIFKPVQECWLQLVFFMSETLRMSQKFRERPDGGFTVLDGHLRAQIDGDSIIVMIIQVCCWRQNF